MKFTVHIPLGETAPGEFQTQPAIEQMAGALEQAGVDACYLTDHPAPDAAWLSQGMGHDALDPFTAFAFVAAASKRLRLHTNILVMAYRNPFLTAKAAATMQVLSGGRLILGLGAGYQKVEFEALGINFHERGALFDEALEVLRLAWAGGAVTYRGRHFNAVGNEPRPALDNPPPVWIGGGSGKAVERAARFGDGWSPFFAVPTMTAANRESGIHSVEQLAETIVRLQDLRTGFGRSGPFDVAIGPKMRLKFGQRDSAEQYLQALGDMAEAGVTWTMADPPHASRQEFCDNVQWFGEEVIAKLRG